ncbi:MAG: hypothetical protein JJU29_02815 [Verrucomicrobia bacterium]|nr:hypothetical protein [Verrucomicrobiota bacterium]MCH8511426.1 hypothetical protein [Kiritimatiellia bacterium]
MGTGLADFDFFGALDRVTSSFSCFRWESFALASAWFKRDGDGFSSAGAGEMLTSGAKEASATAGRVTSGFFPNAGFFEIV